MRTLRMPRCLAISLILASAGVQIVGHRLGRFRCRQSRPVEAPRSSVGAALTSEFKVDAARMTTDGKGEAEPVGAGQRRRTAIPSAVSVDLQ